MFTEIAVGWNAPLGDPSIHGWDFWPIVGILIALFFVRRVLRKPLTLPSIICSFFAGTVFASAVDRFGVIPIAAWVVPLALIGTRRRGVPPGATPV